MNEMMASCCIYQKWNMISEFFDGQIVGSATESGSFFNNSDDDVGVGSASGESASEIMDGFLISALSKEVQFTPYFTPPPAPLTNITNTKLLCGSDTTSFLNGGQPILNTTASGSTTNRIRKDIFSSMVYALPMKSQWWNSNFDESAELDLV